jgi:raffinose/stachyose/melibiose transport system substrate-binding protein
MATRKLRSALATRHGVVVAVVAGLVVPLAACSSDGGSTSLSSGTTSATGSTTAAQSPSEAALSGELSILVSSADASDAAFKAVADAFTAEYPDVKVTLTPVSNSTYKATESSQLTAGTVDLFVPQTFREVPDYAKDSTSSDVLLAQAGGLVDLTDQPFMKNFSQTVLDAQAIGGKQYAVPTGVSYETGVYYNKKIFEDNGLSVPTTWSELTDVMAKLKGAGVTPFGIGGKDTWPAGLIMLGAAGSLYPTREDKQSLTDDLWAQKASLTDEKELSVLQKVKTVFDNAQANFSGAGYDDIPAGFARGDYAMIADGTWNQPTIDKAVAGAFDYGYFPFPGSDTAADNALLNGKIELQLSIPSSSKHQDLALAFLDFFAQPDVYAKFVATSGFSSAAADPTEVSDFLASIADYTKDFQPAWDQIWIPNNDAGSDAVYPFDYPALAPLGTSTPEQAAQVAQTSWSSAF